MKTCMQTHLHIWNCQGTWVRKYLWNWEIFKIFLYDPSNLLENSDSPELANITISHLLWADDLIILSLNQNLANSSLTH